MTTHCLVLAYFALATTIAQITESPPMQDSPESKEASLTSQEILERALESELSISNIKGRVEHKFFIDIPGMADRNVWAQFLVSFDGRYSYNGRDIIGDEWIGAYDGTTVVRVYQASMVSEAEPDGISLKVTEIYPISVLDRKPWDLSYHALGPLEYIWKAARPLHAISESEMGSRLEEIPFVVSDESDDSVTLQGNFESQLVSITLMPKRGYNLSRYTTKWEGGSSTEFFEDHVETNSGHWVTRRYWREFYTDGVAEASIYGEVSLRDLETNTLIEEDSFVAPAEAVIIADYRTFSGWLKFWMSEYSIGEFPEASESLHESYPIAWYTLLVCPFVLIVLFFGLGLRALRRRFAKTSPSDRTEQYSDG